MLRISGPASAMHRKILSMDYYFLLQSSSHETRWNPAFVGNLPEIYPNLDNYLNLFGNVILEESIAQILNENKNGVKFQNVIGITVFSQVKSEGFLNIKLLMKSNLSLSYADYDLVILSKDRIMNKEVLKSCTTLHIFGLVTRSKQSKELNVKLYLDESSQTGIINGSMRIMLTRTGLATHGTEWFLSKICNLATICREYEAVRNVRYAPFMDQIVKRNQYAIESALSWHENRRELDVQNPRCSVMGSNYNSEQIEAITAGIYGKPIILIQGPPGTGKTRTILGILAITLQMGMFGYFRRSNMSNLQSNGIKNESKYLGKKNYKKSTVATSKICSDMVINNQTLMYNSNKTTYNAHILVCAPSNSALDEITLRLLDMGLVNLHGNSFTPSITRVGLNIHPSVMSVSIQHLLDSYTAEMGVVGKVLSKESQEKIRINIIREASIVCSTLSLSGSSVFSLLDRPFDVLIVDEASQAVEPSTLVPMCQGILQVYLVGDPSQLPATVLSSCAINRGYNMGLFSRLMRGGYPVKRLKTQYRMHPLIREYPSSAFYGGLLRDGDGVEKDTIRPWHDKKCFGPLSFYDVRGQEEQAAESSSIYKEHEAQLSVELFLYLTAFYPELKSCSQIGIISPYKDQVKLIRRKLAEALGGFHVARKHIDVNTLDGFQGKEKDLVIFSAVRSKMIEDIGFVADERRLNVGLTRARSSLIILGHIRSLYRDLTWKSLIEHCRDRGQLFRINSKS